MSESLWPAALAHNVLNTVWSALTSMTVPVASPLLLYDLAGESGVITLVSVTILSAWLVNRMRQDLPHEPAERRLASRPMTLS